MSIRKTGIAAFAGVAVVSVLSLQVFADQDEDGYRVGGWYKRTDFAPVKDPLYVAECGDCHMAYQPGMLPAASWERIMDGLKDHFGDNAELAAGTAQALRALLVRNAADRVDTGRSPRVAGSLGGAAPLRFSETRYFRHKHHEISDARVKANPGVGSFARCDACHTGALDGNYDEHAVRIPGHGRWDD